MPATRRALSLSLLLGAGVACDENTPTETRASAATQIESPEYNDVTASDGISAQSIVLPVDQPISTVTPAPAFRIRQNGTGPNASFTIGSATNAQTGLLVSVAGLGRAGWFQTTNGSSASAAVDARGSGTSFTLRSVAAGRGGAGFFQNSSSTSHEFALSVRSAARGRAAAFFESTNTDRRVPAVYMHHPQNTVLQVVGGGNGDGPTMIIDQQISGVPDGVEPALQVNAGPASGAPPTAAQFNGAVNIVSSAATAGFRVGTASVQTHSEFRGSVKIFGTLSKAAGSFQIDHPLDPEHKYLSHSFVESPDMMNVYNGNVTLDELGRATVELPAYFEALNRDFRYQLTAVGTPGPNLYVAEGVTRNRFKIAGGRAYARVSWQVTGVRQDSYANEHRIRVEEDKPQAEMELVASSEALPSR